MLYVPRASDEVAQAAIPVAGETATLAQMVVAEPPCGVSVKVTEPERGTSVFPVDGVIEAVKVTNWLTVEALPADEEATVIVPPAVFTFWVTKPLLPL